MIRSAAWITLIAWTLVLLNGFPSGIVQAQSPGKRKVEFQDRKRLAQMESPRIDESSGLIASPAYAGCYWTHNDNGRFPGLFLIDEAGQLRARVSMPEIPFRDWEDISLIRVQDQNFLLIADVGDNLAKYESCRIQIIEEPTVRLVDNQVAELELSLNKIRTLEFTYPDGPRDCEAIFADSESRSIYLIAKSMDPADEDPSGIYRLDFPEADSSKVQVATRLKSGFRSHMVTGAAISPDHNLVAIRSYTTAWIFEKTDGQSWEVVFSRAEPIGRTLLPIQKQGEAISFNHPGTALLITSEGLRQPIWQLDFLIEPNDR